MALVVCVQVVWEDHRLPVPVSLVYRSATGLRRAKFMPLHIRQETGYPVGRKGLALAAAWEQLGPCAKADGMVVLDGDVAVDPVHVAAMLGSIDDDPGSVWTAPVRIWPVSTHRSDWVWAHWDDHASQQIDDEARSFSFCFTYLPAALVERAIRDGMKDWVYPRVDSSMAATARKMGIKGRVVPCEPPVHLHF